MSLDDLDPLLNGPKRLAAMGVIASSQKVEFLFLRDHLELSDSDMSKQMSTLAKADYVKVRKVGKGRVAKTWYSATAKGKRALEAHVAALNNLASGLAETKSLQL